VDFKVRKFNGDNSYVDILKDPSEEPVDKFPVEQLIE
jgi:hypothetical protein